MLRFIFQGHKVSLTTVFSSDAGSCQGILCEVTDPSVSRYQIHGIPSGIVVAVSVNSFIEYPGVAVTRRISEAYRVSDVTIPAATTLVGTPDVTTTSVIINFEAAGTKTGWLIELVFIEAVSHFCFILGPNYRENFVASNFAHVLRGELLIYRCHYFRRYHGERK